jgi:hypothetical protein
MRVGRSAGGLGAAARGVSRLFSRPTTSPDARPALFSVISLIVLLIPMLLLTSSLERTTGLPLGVAGSDDDLPPEPIGRVESLRVERIEAGYLLTAEVRNTDVRSSAGDTERKQLTATDLAALQTALQTFKGLDPDRKRITLQPSADTTTDEVVRWMDAVRVGPQGELYPRVVLEAAP